MNNINFEIVKDTVQAMQEDPSLKMKSWNANIEWKDGVENIAQIREFDSFIVDEPTPLGGTDLGANPVENLIAAAASCFAITFQVLASQKGIKINKMKTNIDADLNAAVFLGLEEGNGGILNPKITLDADTSASKEEITELAKIALSKSPVIISLAMDVDLEVL